MMNDTEIIGTMQIDGKIVAAYNKNGEAIYLAPGWELVDGSLRQVVVEPVRFYQA